MTSITNNPRLAGEIAGKRELVGRFNRYAVAPVHTRFDAVEWFVWDAEQQDDAGLPLVVRQADTREAAVRGLA
jgi:hypothetical protein